MAFGRPTSYNPELATKICKAVASSTKGTDAICAENEDFPAGTTVYEWIYTYPDFSKMYWDAKGAQADLFATESMQILDEVREDQWALKKAELRIKQRNWHAARLKPNRWAEKDKENKSTKTSAIESMTLETE